MQACYLVDSGAKRKRKRTTAVPGEWHCSRVIQCNRVSVAG